MEEKKETGKSMPNCKSYYDLKNPIVEVLEEWLEENEPKLDLTIEELNKSDTDDN
jgi:hypothetical protein